MAANNLFVVDSSFILSLLLPDEKILPLAKKNLKLLTEPENKFFSPHLLEYEVGNGIRSALLRKRITIDSSERLIKNFNLLPIKKLGISIDKVLSISVKKGLSFYDAAYVFLAISQNAKLLTLDKKLSSLIER